ncbi:MAG: histone H1/H5 family protein [Cyanobacteria bacterium J06649_11]
MSDKPAKKSAPKKPADHPKYIEMIQAAVSALKERNGSSRQAIIKYIKANYNVKENCENHIKMALKKGVAAGTLTQPKGTGASGSFKLAKPAPKPKKEAPAKKPATKKPAAKKTTKKTPTKKPAKATTKKTPTKKKPAKKATSAKKPAAKKAKKPVAKKPAAKKAKKTPTKKKPAAKK